MSDNLLILQTYLQRNHHIWQKYHTIFDHWLVSSFHGQKALESYTNTFSQWITTDPNIEMAEDVYEFIMLVLTTLPTFSHVCRELSQASAGWVILSQIKSQHDITPEQLKQAVIKQFRLSADSPRISLYVTNLLAATRSAINKDNTTNNNITTDNTTDAPLSSSSSPLQTLTLPHLSEAMPLGIVCDQDVRTRMFQGVFATSTSIPSHASPVGSSHSHHHHHHQQQQHTQQKQPSSKDNASQQYHIIPFPMDDHETYTEIETVLCGAYTHCQSIFIKTLLHHDIYTSALNIVINSYIGIIGLFRRYIKEEYDHITLLQQQYTQDKYNREKNNNNLNKKQIASLSQSSSSSSSLPSSSKLDLVPLSPELQQRYLVLDSLYHTIPSTLSSNELLTSLSSHNTMVYSLRFLLHAFDVVFLWLHETKMASALVTLPQQQKQASPSSSSNPVTSSLTPPVLFSEMYDTVINVCGNRVIELTKRQQQNDSNNSNSTTSLKRNNGAHKVPKLQQQPLQQEVFSQMEWIGATSSFIATWAGWRCEISLQDKQVVDNTNDVPENGHDESTSTSTLSSSPSFLYQTNKDHIRRFKAMCHSISSLSSYIDHSATHVTQCIESHFIEYINHLLIEAPVPSVSVSVSSVSLSESKQQQQQQHPPSSSSTLNALMDAQRAELARHGLSLPPQLQQQLQVPLSQSQQQQQQPSQPQPEIITPPIIIPPQTHTTHTDYRRIVSSIEDMAHLVLSGSLVLPWFSLSPMMITALFQLDTFSHYTREQLDNSNKGTTTKPSSSLLPLVFLKPTLSSYLTSPSSFINTTTVTPISTSHTPITYHSTTYTPLLISTALQTSKYIVSWFEPYTFGISSTLPLISTIIDPLSHRQVSNDSIIQLFNHIGPMANIHTKYDHISSTLAPIAHGFAEQI